MTGSILIIFFISLGIISSAYAEIDNETSIELKELSSSVDELSSIIETNQKKLDSFEIQIDEIKSMISNNDEITNQKLSEITNNLQKFNELSMDEITQQFNFLNSTLISHSEDFFDSDKLANQLAQIQFTTSALIAVITTLLGMVGGFYLVSLREKKKTRIELENARKDIQTEFSRINQEICYAIRDTRDVLNDLSGGIGIINRIISRQITPHDELRPHLHGLKFVLWQFTVPHMREFTTDEKDDLARLHDLIDQASTLLVRQHHTPLKQRLEELLRSRATNGVIATEMRDELIQNFVERMKIYGQLYRYMQNLKIEWLNIPSFSKTR